MAVLGPGGEWIKNKTNEITKGLIQQYQNFTSQSPQQTIGRLNGDGTATLPDGSRVEVIERGTPGLYCILYNMGNGKWLADLPKPKHINVDGFVDPSVYALITVFNQQADPNSYIGTYYISPTGPGSEAINEVTNFTNICGLDSVWLSNLSSQTIYQLDPSLYSEFSEFTPNIDQSLDYLDRFPQVSESNLVCPIGKSTAPIFVEGWSTGEFYSTYSGLFGPQAYTGPSFKLSTECQDILVFQANLEIISDNGTYIWQPSIVRGIGYTNINVGGSSFFIKYKILKDIYADPETGYIKCKSTESGIYTLPETAITNVEPTTSTLYDYLYIPNGPIKRYTARTSIQFNRNTDNEPELSMFVATSCAETTVVSTSVFPDTFTVFQTAFGRRGMLIKSINSSPRIDYDVNLAEGVEYNGEGLVVQNSPIQPTDGEFFRGKFTGYHTYLTSLGDPYDSQRMDPINLSFQETFTLPTGNLQVGVITDTAYIPLTNVDFSTVINSDFDFTYAFPVALGVAFGIDNSVQGSVGAGYRAIGYNTLFLGSFGITRYASRLTDSLYAYLVPYVDSENTSARGFNSTKKGLAILAISTDGTDVSGIRVGKNLIDTDYLSSIILEKAKYLTASGQQFMILPFTDIGVGMYKI